MRITFNPLAATALIGAAALTLAGCASGDGDDDATPEPSDEMSSTADAGEGGGEGLPEELILGLVPSDEVDQLVTDGDILAELLSAELGVDVTTFIPDSYSAVVVAMQTEQAHIGFLGPIAMVQAVDEASAVPVLQSVRYGSSSYVTQWMTNDPDTFCLDEVTTEADDEGVNFSYCNGATGYDGPQGEDALELIDPSSQISFVDPSSASGYYYPATQLETILGIDPLTDLAGAFFAGGHPQSVQAVYDGDAVVGTSFNDARSELSGEFPDVGEEVVVFAYSTNIPNDGVVLNGDLSADAQQQITDALMAIASTDEGLAALDAVYNIEGLEPADVEALDQARQVAANFGEE
ncbi:phosphate/phosphite/phosphonate ABC transporter substrate-binding protein [Demequina muriae]|uniref:Phosphate/phosphite/phosphonate ABC transporter substrate-binding protein n=1 Tax=Demequina muriae TaxID=3051664 RepID=A0ABT8GJ60_9MICO|nr:phosphate/phosphite/phosphonate ABC transporter substrate-binding protein [Demequina sp. EGI L300058]MDN4481462.1 phosphate/phosphite/phosphonate ABC transporter substrate-binding protein [Demequina sp. EGI L300058]